jgi:predicted RNA-binding Zn-ribbon protein involved in translation (DUF1610 family)
MRDKADIPETPPNRIHTKRKGDLENRSYGSAMFCPNCGKKLKDHATFCPRCGQEIVPPDPSQYPENDGMSGGNYKAPLIIVIILAAIAASIMVGILFLDGNPLPIKKANGTTAAAQTASATEAAEEISITITPEETEEKTATATPAAEEKETIAAVPSAETSGENVRSAPGAEHKYTGWIKENGNWRYYNDGSYAADGWEKIDGRWYCFDADGYMLKDTITSDGYRLGSDGALVDTQEVPAPSAEAAEVPSDNVYFTKSENMWVAGCNESITLRTSPRKSASEITQIPLYAGVYKLENAGNGFDKVVYNGWTGYAMSEYLTSYEPQTYTGRSLMVVNCNEYITLRTSPYTSADEITRIPLGAEVDYIEAKKDFYLVSYNGQIGYALQSYLIFT